MKIAVYDTYVTRKDHRRMHFDILIEDTQSTSSAVLEKVFEYGEIFLAKKNQAGQILTAKECRFCHVETATAKVLEDIAVTGFSIIEMENCD